MRQIQKKIAKYEQSENIFTCGKKKLPYLLSKDQLLHIMKKVDDAKLAMVIYIATFQGLRIGEIVKLLWEDVDLENGEIMVRDGKNTKRYKSGYGKDRKVPINEMFIPLYRKWRAMCSKSRFVIPSMNEERRGAKTMIKYYQDQFKYLLDKAGLLEVAYYQKNGGPRYKYHIHTLRHVCGTNLYRAGLDLYKIKRFLGHEDIETTQVYCDLAIDDLRSASHLAYAYPKSRLAGPQAPVIEINVDKEQLMLQKEILDKQLELARLNKEGGQYGYLPQQEIRNRIYSADE